MAGNEQMVEDLGNCLKCKGNIKTEVKPASLQEDKEEKFLLSSFHNLPLWEEHIMKWAFLMTDPLCIQMYYL